MGSETFARFRRWPRSLRQGLLLWVALGLVAVTAPLVATDLPWLARTDGRIVAPALVAWLGGHAGSGDVSLVRAPVPYDPAATDLPASLSTPSSTHWLGTDVLGRDMASRVLHGARVSLGVGLLSAILALIVGVPLGALAGYAGGWIDAAVSRAVETVLCFPVLLLALAVLALGSGRLEVLSPVPRMALVLGATGWTPVTRYLRAEFLRLRRSDMVAAARASGAGHLRIVTLHILPGALAPVLITAAFTVGAAMLVEATLSFLGVGVSAEVATWGGLLSESREHVARAWWLAVFPGVALFLAVLACNLTGEGIRAALDPRGGEL